MTILLTCQDYGNLNIFDKYLLNNIKSYLSKTPNEKFIEIHKEMKKYNYKPYRKIKFFPVKYRRYTNFSM